MVIIKLDFWYKNCRYICIIYLKHLEFRIYTYYNLQMTTLKDLISLWTFKDFTELASWIYVHKALRCIINLRWTSAWFIFWMAEDIFKILSVAETSIFLDFTCERDCVGMHPIKIYGWKKEAAFDVSICVIKKNAFLKFKRYK